VLDAVLGSSRQLFSWTESSTALMTAAAVATLTSGNEQRYAETAAVLAIAVGAVCVLGWLARLGFWPTACGSAVTCAAGLATRALVLTMCDDVSVLAALCAGAYGYTLKEPDRTRSSPPYG